MTGNLNRKQQLIAGILRTSSMQLQKRIEDLLNFSALQAEIITLTKQSVDLKNMINSVIRAQNLSVLSKNLTISVDCPKVLLECDKQKLDIMLDNLLSNAVKFSPVYGQIEVVVLSGKNKVQIDVMDSGPGVDNMDGDRIFEPFYQGRNTPENHAKGTGLGLAIAKEYATAHGGNIELVQDGKKCGAHFRLTIPTNSPEATS